MHFIQTRKLFDDLCFRKFLGNLNPCQGSEGHIPILNTPQTHLNCTRKLTLSLIFKYFFQDYKDYAHSYQQGCSSHYANRYYANCPLCHIIYAK